MNSSRKKRWGLLIPLALLSVLSGLVWEAKREVRQQALNRALLTAIRKNEIPKVVSLLAQGADPDVRDLRDTRSTWQHVWDRVRGKRIPTGNKPTALLAVLAARPYDTTITPTFQPENVPLVSALLKAGANVNVSVEGGSTPLIWATIAQKRETVRLLLERGAYVNAQDGNCGTALYYAAFESDPVLVRLLLAHGATPNMGVNYGAVPLHITALHTAALNGQTEIARMLCESGASVDARQWDGETPLCNAARVGNIDCVRLLVARGAQVTVKDRSGLTPLAYAKSIHNVSVVAMLQSVGATE